MHKPKTMLYIVRHGQNEDNANGILNGHRDMPLTELGREQARKLAASIRTQGLQFDAVYASPLSRALETARILADGAGLSRPQTYDDLIERDFGDMTGRPASDIKKLCAPDIIETDTVTYFLRPDDAETFPELLARGRRVCNDMVRRHPQQVALLVCHGDIGKMIYAAVTKTPWRVALTEFHFDNTDIIGPFELS